MKTIIHPRASLAVLALIAGVLASQPRIVAGPAGSSQGLAGHWEGTIDLPTTKLAIRFDFARADDGADWTGSIDIPVQMVRGHQLADIVVDDDAVSFRMPNIPGDPTFAGKLAPGGARFTGTFSQAGQSYPFAVERRAATPEQGETPSQGVPGTGLVGHWQGSLRVGSVALRLVLHVKPGDGDALVATLDSIDQGARDIPVSTVQFADGEVKLELATIGARYTGRMVADGSTIEGRWKQGQLDAPLDFRRLAQAPKLVRPQEPRKPYPYDEHDVQFAGGSAGVTLAGTITIPRGEGTFPGAVLLSGSGAQDRDETLMGHRPFLVLADHLTRNGFAVLRFDDRGFGRSTGDFRMATHEDFAADARAAFEFLRAQPKVDADRVGLCGHSEGAVHAALVAATEKDVAFVVMLAGAGVPVGELIARQRQDLLRVMGATHAVPPEHEVLNREIFSVLRTLGGSDVARERVRELLVQMASAYTPEQQEAIGLSRSMIEQQVAILTSPWFIQLLGFDPAPVLAKVGCPVLALNGEKDVQVAAHENLEGIRRALEAGGNTDVTTRVLPDLNHLFQHSHTGAPSEYGTIEETMSPDVLGLVSDWIRRRTQR